MKKTVAVLVIAVVLFASSGLVQACELCDKLYALGYTQAQIVQLISGSRTRPEAEARMRQAIAAGKTGQPATLALKPQPKYIFLENEVEVPPMRQP